VEKVKDLEVVSWDRIITPSHDNLLGRGAVKWGKHSGPLEITPWGGMEAFPTKRLSRCTKIYLCVKKN